MSEAKWKKLAPDIQAAITKAGEAATRHACEATDQAVAADVAKIHAKGTTPEPFPEAAQQTGRAPGWERECQYLSTSVGDALSQQKKTNTSRYNKKLEHK